MGHSPVTHKCIGKQFQCHVAVLCAELGIIHHSPWLSPAQSLLSVERSQDLERRSAPCEDDARTHQEVRKRSGMGPRVQLDHGKMEALQQPPPPLQAGNGTGAVPHSCTIHYSLKDVTPAPSALVDILLMTHPG